MAAPTMSRPGQVNNAGAVDALFLKQFSGEVMTAFEQSNVMMPLHTVRTITNGKSTSFPTVGLARARYHDPGEDLLDTADVANDGYAYSPSEIPSLGAAESLASGVAYGSSIPHNEVILTVDKLLLSTTFVPEIEELENHYDVRSYYSREMGNALSYTADRHLLMTAIKASETVTAANPDFGTNAAWQDTGGAGNTATVNADLAAGATATNFTTAFINAMFKCAERFDTMNVPNTERYCVIPPAQYYKLFTVSSGAGPVIVNRDTGNTNNGSLSRPAESIEIAGIRIFKSTHFPTGDKTGLTLAKYAGNFSNYVGVVFHKSAIGTVKLMDLSMQSEYRIDRQGTLLVARYAMGHGVLRPECAIRLKSA